VVAGHVSGRYGSGVPTISSSFIMWSCAEAGPSAVGDHLPRVRDAVRRPGSINPNTVAKAYRTGAQGYAAVRVGRDVHRGHPGDGSTGQAHVLRKAWCWAWLAERPARACPGEIIALFMAACMYLQAARLHEPGAAGGLGSPRRRSRECRPRLMLGIGTERSGAAVLQHGIPRGGGSPRCRAQWGAVKTTLLHLLFGLAADFRLGEGAAGPGVLGPGAGRCLRCAGPPPV